DADDLVTQAGDLKVVRHSPTGRVDRLEFAAQSSGKTRTDFSYDAAFGELVGIAATHDPLGSSVGLLDASYERDQLGRVVEAAEDLNGNETVRRYEYDSVGRLVEVRDGDDSLVYEYDYDENGNREEVVDHR